MSIFDKRVAFKPFEYPDISKFKTAISHSFWLVSEWNFVSDIQDFKTKLTPPEKSAIKNALLAISQIEVSVKRFWTNLGNRFPKAEFEQVGVTFGESECYDAETEVLTTEGWVKFPLLQEDTKVAQFDHVTNKITFVMPSNYLVRHYKGIMHHYDSDGTDLMVTPNHEILVMHPQKDFYEKRKSCDGKWGCNYRYPIAGQGVGDESVKFSDLDRLLIAIQADGSLFGCTPTGKGRRDVCFNLKKERKIERLRELLRKNGIDWSESDREKGFKAFNFKLPDEVCEVEKIKGFDYVDLEKVTSQYGQAFIEELRKWDGANREGLTSFTYYNANQSAIDKVQAICALCGYSSNKGINRTAEESLARPLPDGSMKKSAQTVYALNVSVDLNKKVYPYRNEVEYDGVVYCVTVPSGNVVTRRNKRVAISGNCRHSDAYSHLLEILGLNDDFAMLLQNPVIQGRVDYLTKYLKGASDNSNENYTLTLTLFSIFIENVSLFSQFLVIKSFNKYMNTLKDIDNVVQSTMKEECYAEGTEILTPNGWVDFRDINIGDEVVQYNHGKLEFVPALHKTNRFYEGDMYHFHKSKTQCLVTPGHEMVYYDRNGKFKKVKAEKFIPGNSKHLPHGGNLENVGISEFSFEDRLKIAIQADATVSKWTNTNGEELRRGKDGGYSHSFGLTKQRKKDRLEWILSNTNVEWIKILDKDTKEITYKIKFFDENDYKEFDWVNLRDKSIEWCQEFIKECINWDGYVTANPKTSGYSSTNKKCIDKVQTIAILAGYRTSIQTRVDERKETYKDCYKLTFMEEEINPVCHGLKKDKINYSGNVYCVTVPSGVIVTRYKNDVMIAGNCIHALFGVEIIKIIQKEFPDWFNEEFYNKLQRACKKAYEAECNIIDWIFEAGDLPFIGKDGVKEFTKNRFNESLEMIGCNKVFDVDMTKLEQFNWFEDEVHAEVNTDFFHKKSVNYSKSVKSITSTDLF